MQQTEKRVAIIGAGALGQQLAQHLRQAGRIVAGFFDDVLPVGPTNNGLVLGPLAAATDAFAAGYFDELLLAIGYQHMSVRARLFEQLLAAELPFGQFVHVNAYVDRSATLGPGVCIWPGCVLDLNVVLEANVLLYPGCIIAHDTQVGAHSLLGPGVQLAGRVRVGEQCFLGVGTTVIDSLQIGPKVRTGGGTVVVRDLPTPGTYAGVPARRLS